MSYSVYILQCTDHSHPSGFTFYCGSTNNIEKRVKQHNESKDGARYTKIRRPVRLVYFEEHPNQSTALKREAEIKKLSRKEKEEIINSSIIPIAPSVIPPQ